ncbi:hypothetical protein [Papillibacter cinnamivorans]|uniref:Uncharacterized protein n=1 Tax=Papillibacter cinnamivorans DSM 12816 TaxID=1122930 RepID=A0A1W1YZP8_9FIRM|nr:hypothetical protein [Papillibacter cinnamivorans]SMC41168.1 hypothetical protein SAMN02745168_0778 [Papillibacter cinnamivorans DSM 12816]
MDIQNRLFKKIPFMYNLDGTYYVLGQGICKECSQYKHKLDKFLEAAGTNEERIEFKKLISLATVL